MRANPPHSLHASSEIPHFCNRQAHLPPILETTLIVSRLLARPVNEDQNNRDLSANEHRLVQWMLEHGSAEAREFLPQLAVARVTPWRCECGCASFHLFIPGYRLPSGGVHPIADFVFGTGTEHSGIFAYEQGGTLSGVEVYGLAGDAPSTLPTPDMLQPFSNATANG